HAARHGAGYGPKTPGAEAVREAEGFAAAARRLGYADPNAVDHHLRAATTAFLARDYAAARHIFEALLRPIAAADVDLGEQELVDGARRERPRLRRALGRVRLRDLAPGRPRGQRPGGAERGRRRGAD